MDSVSVLAGGFSVKLIYFGAIVLWSEIKKTKNLGYVLSIGRLV
jgi:hypothetical protein